MHAFQIRLHYYLELLINPLPPMMTHISQCDIAIYQKTTSHILKHKSSRPTFSIAISYLLHCLPSIPSQSQLFVHHITHHVLPAPLHPSNIHQTNIQRPLHFLTHLTPLPSSHRCTIAHCSRAKSNYHAVYPRLAFRQAHTGRLRETH